MARHLDLEVDYSRDDLIDEFGKTRLRDSYMMEGEKSPQERFAYVSKKFGSNRAHAQRLYDYVSKHWLSYSTPILSYGRSEKALPISCYLNYIDDSSGGLVDNLSETNWLSMMGGGIGIGFGIRSSDDKSTGVLPHLKIYDASVLAYRQGKTRRGSYAAYLDISHPDILMFIDLRKPTGDQNMRCHNMNHGINIPDSFMQIIERCMVDPNADDSWDLIDPHTKRIVNTVSAKEIWQRILELRMLKGEPYLHFIDASNRGLNPHQKAMGLTVKQSNLCSEIILATDKERTAVCCLSSVNLEYYDDWKSDPLFIADVLEMLDNVLSEFIARAPDTIRRAKYSAERERSVGVGALGFHALLQKRGIPFESALAKSLNIQIFKKIRNELDVANRDLAKRRGEPMDLLGTGTRFAHVMAIAPNASSSIIMGNTSPSIEPFKANAYRQDTTSGSYLNKNRHLDKLIKEKCKNDSTLDYDAIWESIVITKGSIQHLDIFTDYEKDIFKTALEIDQRWVIEHAADRQGFIDQSQSLNVFFLPTVNIKYLHAVHFLAWKRNLKTMYYCRSEKVREADSVSKRIEREIIEEIDLEAIVNDEECLACQ